MSRFNVAPPAQTWSNPPKRPVWPIAIGVISLVLAGLGCVCTPASIVLNAINPRRAQLMDRLPAWFATYDLISHLVGLGLSFLLLIAGIQLVRRQPSAAALHLTYSGIGLVAVLAAVLVLGSALGSSDLYGPERAVFIGALVVGMVIGLTYPVFLLIWFLRGSVRREVASWSPASASPHGT